MEAGVGRREKGCPTEGRGLGVALWREEGCVLKSQDRLSQRTGKLLQRLEQIAEAGRALSGGVLAILCFLQLPEPMKSFAKVFRHIGVKFQLE